MSVFPGQIKRELKRLKKKHLKEEDITAEYKLIKHYWKAYLNDKPDPTDEELDKARDMFAAAVEMMQDYLKCTGILIHYAYTIVDKLHDQGQTLCEISGGVGELYHQLDDISAAMKKMKIHVHDTKDGYTQTETDSE